MPAAMPCAEHAIARRRAVRVRTPHSANCGSTKSTPAQSEPRGDKPKYADARKSNGVLPALRDTVLARDTSLARVEVRHRETFGNAERRGGGPDASKDLRNIVDQIDGDLSFRRNGTFPVETPDVSLRGERHGVGIKFDKLRRQID